MTDKYQNKYRIPSARLRSWDYSSNAAYFITICTAKREHYFGKIIEGKMDLSEQGKMANQFWLEIPNHFAFAFLDEFVVMPNHVHGIIIIDKPDNIENLTGVETGHALSLRQSQQQPVPTTPSPFSQSGKKYNFGNGWFL